MPLKTEKLAAEHPNEKKPVLGERIWLIGGFEESFSRPKHYTYLLRKEFVIYWGRAMSTEPKRTCPSCGTELSGAMEFCPVCTLRQGLSREDESGESSFEEAVSPRPDQATQRFENYEIVTGEDGKPVELGRGAMGVTYKAVDVDLQLPVALKIINARLIGDPSARHRFLREARAAASVRHPNVASVFPSGRDRPATTFTRWSLSMAKHWKSSSAALVGCTHDVALEMVAQIAAGLTAIQKQHLVHRDIKPSNVMVNFEEGRLEIVKIIDLGLAKGIAEEINFDCRKFYRNT